MATRIFILFFVLTIALIEVERFDTFAAEVVVAEGYKISTGDILGIEVHGIEVQGLSALTGGDLPTRVTVRPDGTISYPYVGTIQAAGKTDFELADTIQAALLVKFKRAWVKLSVVEYDKTRTVKVFGEVSAPGTYPINGGRSFLELFTEVGKVGPKADIENIKLIRADGTSLMINFKEIIENPMSPSNVQMLKGDIINVPEKKTRDEEEQKSQPIRIMILGYLMKQGPVFLSKDHSTIIDAIFENGGMTKGKFKSDIFVIRESKGGDPETIKINLEKAITTRDPQYNIQLQENDYVYIPARGDKPLDKISLLLDKLNPATIFWPTYDAMFNAGVSSTVATP